MQPQEGGNCLNIFNKRYAIIKKKEKKEEDKLGIGMNLLSPLSIFRGIVFLDKIETSPHKRKRKRERNFQKKKT